MILKNILGSNRSTKIGENLKQPGLSCAKLRPASLLSLLVLVNSELCKNENQINSIAENEMK